MNNGCRPSLREDVEDVSGTVGSVWAVTGAEIGSRLSSPFPAQSRRNQSLSNHIARSNTAIGLPFPRGGPSEADEKSRAAPTWGVEPQSNDPFFARIVKPSSRPIPAMSSSLPGNRELPASQYDLSTYMGRVRHSLGLTDPR